MSRFTEALRDVGIFSLHNLTQNGHPWIQVNPAQARSATGACAAVHIKGRAFKDVPWYAHGARLFGYYGKEDKAEAIQKALDLTAKLFPDLTMVKGPWRWTWVCKHCLDAAKAKLKEKP